MDDLLREFLTETNESLNLVDAELVRFEQETLTHAAEPLMGKFRDGMPVTAEAVTLILSTIDRIKSILEAIETSEQEPEGGDRDLIDQLGRMARQEAAAPPQVAPSPPAPAPVERKMPDKPEPPERAEKQDKPVAERPDEERGDRLANHSIRVNVDTLDHLMTTVSELVLTRNQLLEIVRRHEDSDFKVPLQRLSNVTAELQEGVMKTRMQPIGNAWQKLPRVVRDLSAELGKDIELAMRGADNELDRQVLDLVKDPLTHLVRNCADHGIESPAARIAAGKPPKGTIRLSAWHEGGHLIIEIFDNGRRLHPD